MNVRAIVCRPSWRSPSQGFRPHRCQWRRRGPLPVCSGSSWASGRSGSPLTSAATGAPLPGGGIRFVGAFGCQRDDDRDHLESEVPTGPARPGSRLLGAQRTHVVRSRVPGVRPVHWRQLHAGHAARRAGHRPGGRRSLELHRRRRIHRCRRCAGFGPWMHARGWLADAVGRRRKSPMAAARRPPQRATDFADITTANERQLT